MSNISMKMKNLVEISSLVAESTNFFEIKDKIIEKMLEVVFPRKACVNLFYNNWKWPHMVLKELDITSCHFLKLGIEGDKRLLLKILNLE